MQKRHEMIISCIHMKQEKGIWEGESMNQNFYEAVEDNPIIAAVKSMEDVEDAVNMMISESFLFYSGMSVLLAQL